MAAEQASDASSAGRRDVGRKSADFIAVLLVLP